MGEIKFRAMPKEEFTNRELILDTMAYYSQESEYDGTFVYGYLADGYIIGETIDADEDYYNPMFWIPIEKETVGQYTGIKDKKGKEIYEGDILTAEEYPFQDEGKLNYNGKVFWSENEAMFGVELHNVNPNNAGISNGICEVLTEIEYEVIGNIYENPELLEG